MKDDIQITFENFSFINSRKTSINKNYICEFFGKDKNIFKQDSIIIFSNNTFENSAEYRTTTDTTNLSNDAYSGKKSFILKPNSFSDSFIFPINSIGHGNITIYASCWVKSKIPVQDIVLVISIGGNNIWRAEKIKNQTVDNNEWNNIINRLEYDIPDNAKGEIKIYLWNNSKNEILTDDFAVTIERKP